MELELKSVEFKEIETKCSLNPDSIIVNKSKNETQRIAQKSIITHVLHALYCNSILYN
jgi:hypothetical protein